MSRRKQIDPSILEDAKQFNTQEFAKTIKGEFSDFPDPRLNHSPYAKNHLVGEKMKARYEDSDEGQLLVSWSRSYLK